MPSLEWYLRRAISMSPREVLYRLRLAVKKREWRKRIHGASRPPLLRLDWSKVDWTPLRLQLDPHSSEARDLVEEAQAYLRHEWRFFGLSGLVEEPIDWHRDPTTGRTSPRVFGFDINHRDEELVGDIKVTWEKNRHHHLTVMALAYQLTSDERYASEVVDQLLDWVQQNPYCVGVNWTHPLEQGIRLISWVWCERLLRGSQHHHRAFGPDSPIWRSVYDQQEFIVQTLSHGSSANNHLIGELAGLYIAATAWPIFDRSPEWQRLAEARLEREIVTQTFPSGLNRELAFSYHVFVIEFFILVLGEGRRCGRPLSASYTATLTRMMTVMAELTDVAGNLPRFGDGDEGMAVQLQASGSPRDAWLYHAGYDLLGADLPSPDGGRLASSVLGCVSIARDGFLPQGSMALPDAGVFLLANQRGKADEIFVLADAGPLGFLSIAAHGHADALSFTLNAGGVPVIVDPGTYVYHTDPAWRSYFRGTSAHNTLMVDGVDQSVQGGAFMWTRKAHTRVLHWEPAPNGGTLVAEHDGYARLVGRVLHRRRMTLEGQHLEVRDDLIGQGYHSIEFRLHFAPGCQVNLRAASKCLVQWAGGELVISLDSRLQWRTTQGEAGAGWYSSGFRRKLPSFTLIGTIEAPLPITLANIVEVSHGS